MSSSTERTFGIYELTKGSDLFKSHSLSLFFSSPSAPPIDFSLISCLLLLSLRIHGYFINLSGHACHSIGHARSRAKHEIISYQGRHHTRPNPLSQSSAVREEFLASELFLKLEKVLAPRSWERELVWPINCASCDREIYANPAFPP
jgi:hypothetical protein